MNSKPQRRIYLKEFKAISRAISTYDDLVLLHNHFVEGVCRSFNVKGCCIMLYDDREKQLVRVASYGLSDAYLKKGPIIVNSFFTEFETGEPLFIQDIQKDRRVQYPAEAAKEGIVSMLSVPIKYKNTVIGLLKIYNGVPWILHEEDQDSFCVLAEQLGMRIEINGFKNFFDHVKGALVNLPLRMLEDIV